MMRAFAAASLKDCAALGPEIRRYFQKSFDREFLASVASRRDLWRILLPLPGIFAFVADRGDNELMIMNAALSVTVFLMSSLPQAWLLSDIVFCLLFASYIPLHSVLGFVPPSVTAPSGPALATLTMAAAGVNVWILLGFVLISYGTAPYVAYAWTVDQLLVCLYVLFLMLLIEHRATLLQGRSGLQQSGYKALISADEAASAQASRGPVDPLSSRFTADTLSRTGGANSDAEDNATPPPVEGQDFAFLNGLWARILFAKSSGPMSSIFARLTTGQRSVASTSSAPRHRFAADKVQQPGAAVHEAPYFSEREMEFLMLCNERGVHRMGRTSGLAMALHRRSYAGVLRGTVFERRKAETIDAFSEAEQEEAPASMQGLMLIQVGVVGVFYGAGIICTLVVYGILQEGIMTVAYDGTLFRYSVFLVLCNRLAAVAFAVAMAIAKGESMKNEAPLWKYLVVSLSNVYASSCQYEALKYVSFAVQMLGKSFKMMPVMIWGMIISGKSYSARDWMIALSVTLGCTEFLMTGPTHSKVDANNSFKGFLLLGGFLALDGLTSTFQEKLFKEHKTTKYNQMLYINLLSATVSMVTLLVTGELWPAAAFGFAHPRFWLDCGLLSASAVASQFFIYSQIKEFGALVFAATMNVRQVVSILVSYVKYHNPVTHLQVLGLCLIFSALFYKSIAAMLNAPSKDEKTPILADQKAVESPLGGGDAGKAV
ncbi:slc35b2 [Symbiodinium sp. KB8]|nr:slc35b2 [Symbiodinium sp. KB8]